MKRRSAALGLLALSASGCVMLRSIGSPMHRVYDRLPPGVNAKSLIVFLPGIADYAEDFERFGFVQAVREQRLPIDMVAVDANLRYLQRGLLAERLHVDVVLPARQQGYKHIWLVGISLGGFSAMQYASQHTDITGIVAIAPFLGRPTALAEITDAGGLDRWQPDATSAMLDWELDAYRWIKAYLPTLKSHQASSATRLIMGLGLQDRYREEQSMLASSLPSEDVFTADGIHDWPVWQDLWRDILVARGDQFAGFN